MLLYRNLVMDAITEVIEPALKDAIEKALCAHYGNNWYDTNGKDIMKSYLFSSNLEALVNQGVPAIKAMDLPAMMYLLDPKTNDDENMEELGDNKGMMLNLAAFYGWTEWQQRRILRLRTIRNLSFHNKLDRNLVPTEEVLKTGKQEMIWLDDAETALKILAPDQDLNQYKNKLKMRVLENLTDTPNNSTPNSMQITPRMVNYIREMEDIRKEIAHFGMFDFTQAPIGAPVAGPAPWSKTNDDLKELQWPSNIKSQKETASQASANNAAQSRTNRQTESNIANDLVNKGVNKLLGWLSGK